MRAEGMLGHLDGLIRQGNELLDEYTPPAPRNSLDDLLRDVSGGPTEAAKPQPGSVYERYVAWLTRSQHALRMAFGDKSDHYMALKACTAKGMHFGEMPRYLGILGAAKADLADGILSTVRDLATADTFDDLLDQAEHLLGRGYHLPAAALAGAVLEDTLRRLCGRLKCLPRGNPMIATLNASLYKLHQAGGFDDYTNTVQKQVTAWGGLRNDVDHHNFAVPGEVDPGDVRRMVEGVRDFVAKHLT